MNWTFSGSGQTGFVVQRATVSTFAGATTFTVANPAARTYSDSSAKQRTTYFYRAAATNILGTGALSNSQSILTK